MLAFLFSVLLSKVATFAIPGFLAGLAILLFVRGRIQWATLAACAAAGWLAVGIIYQEGVAACERRVAEIAAATISRVDAANAEQEAYQRGLVAGLIAGEHELTALIKDNDHEASLDADAGGCGMSLGGVLRYEKIRRGAH